MEIPRKIRRTVRRKFHGKSADIPKDKRKIAELHIIVKPCYSVLNGF